MMEPDDARALLDLAPSCLWENDAQWRALHVNRRVLEFTGLSRETFAERGWQDVIHPDDRPACREIVRSSIEKKRGFSCELRWRRADGEWRWMLSRGEPRLDPDGEVVAFLGSSVDITERRAYELALRESEERYRVIAELTTDVIWDRDLVGHVVTRNFSTWQRFGYAADEVGTAQSWYEERLHPDDRARVLATLASVIEHGGSDWSDEYRFRRADGSYSFVKDRGRVIRDASGRAVRMIGCMTDVTRQKLDEETIDQRSAEVASSRAALDHQRRILDSVLEDMGDGVVVCDAAGKFVVFNRAAREIAGVGAIETTPATWPEDFAIYKPDGVTKFLLEEISLYRALQGESTDQVEMLLKNPAHRPAGRSISITGRPMRDETGAIQGGVVVFRDVSERRRLEAELRQSQKMEALGRLAGGVAHDFNNLLQIILGYAELALARTKADEPLRADLVEVQKAGARGAALTRQLLAFSRKQILAPEVLDASVVLDDLAPMLRRLIGEDVELVTNLAKDLRPIVADAGQLAQVVLNLAVNARDAMPEGGRLTLETRRDGASVLILVSDTGHGMDEETRARAFEPFFTTKGPGKGTGLGLATVYGIVSQMGGHVSLESAPGKGTTFRIALPSVPEPARADAMPARPAEPARARDEVVLLAEDDPHVRRLARVVLEQSGLTVIEAHDGNDALARAEAHAGPIHLLVSDLVMPHLGGRELARRLRERRPELRVLLVSGYPGDARPTELGAQAAFLAKPFTAESLSRKVRDLLDAARSKTS